MKTDRLILKWLTMAILIAVCLLLQVRGSDLQRGITFTDGQRVTASELHQLVDNATVLTGLFTDKSAAGSLGTADLLLIYSGGQLYKISANTALYQNGAIITGQTEDFTPTLDDLLLSYDNGSGVLKKIEAGNLFTNWFNVTPLFTNSVSPGAFFMMLQNGTNFLVAFSNALAIATLATNYPAITNLSTAVQFPLVDTNTALKQVTETNLTRAMIQVRSMTLGLLGPGQGRTNTFSAIGPGFPWPQVIHCYAVPPIAGELGYDGNDKIPIELLQWDPGHTNCVIYGSNGTNSFYKCPAFIPGGFPRLPAKGGTTWSAITTNSWELMVQIIYFPAE